MPKKSFPKFNLNNVVCNAKCVDVYDGDTITVEVDLREIIKKYYDTEYHKKIDELPYVAIYPNCRMAGYNSAEVSRCTADEKEKGLGAKKYLQDLILEKTVSCHFLDKKQGILIKLKNEDPYKRPITDVHLLDENGKKTTYINKLMIESGHAAPYDGHGPKLF